MNHFRFVSFKNLGGCFLASGRIFHIFVPTYRFRCVLSRSSCLFWSIFIVYCAEFLGINYPCSILNLLRLDKKQRSCTLCTWHRGQKGIGNFMPKYDLWKKVLKTLSNDTRNNILSGDDASKYFGSQSDAWLSLV